MLLLKSLFFVCILFISDFSWGQEKGLVDYFKVIGFKPRDNNNSGIQDYNTNLIKNNQCFNNLAAEFYFHLKSRERMISHPKLKSQIDVPSVADKTDSPGWLWDLAMKYANSDSNLAMQLIGVCGHDDRSQLATEMTLSRSSPNAKSSTQVKCPEWSQMFVPGSLGAETMLPEEFLNRLAQIQAPKLGAAYLPAKYYHTIGAAYTSCYLYRAGISDFTINKIVRTSINAYRASRICRELSDRYTLTNEPFEEIWARAQTKDVCVDKKSFACDIKKQLNAFAHIDKKILEQKSRRALVRERARHYFSQSLILERCVGPQVTTMVREYFSENGTGGSKNPCPKDLNSVECKEVRDVMATWAMDFEWSEKQHLQGMAFAKKIALCLKKAKIL